MPVPNIQILTIFQTTICNALISLNLQHPRGQELEQANLQKFKCLVGGGGEGWSCLAGLLKLIYTRILGCIHYVSYRGGQRILGGDLKFLEQKKGGYENCLNISWGDAYFL